MLTLIETVDELGLPDPAGNDLGNKAREIGERIANDDKNDNACHGLDELSKKIADNAKKNKLTAAQAEVARRDRRRHLARHPLLTQRTPGGLARGRPAALSVTRRGASRGTRRGA